MSAEAVGWAFRNSPYRGVPLLVHLALADVTNDVHDNELWMRTDRLAAKARCDSGTARKAILRMIDDGYLALLEDNSPRHRASRYRFLTPDSVAPETRPTDSVAPETRHGRAVDPTAVAPETRPIENSRVRTQGELENTVRDAFEEFWAAWPRKAGKRAALAAWLSAKKRGNTPETIHAGLAPWVAYWRVRAEHEGVGAVERFIPHASTWLNQDRWVDRPPAYAPARSRREAQMDGIDALVDALPASLFAGQSLPEIGAGS